MATDVKQLYDAGDLRGTIAALTEEVKSHPADAARRTFLFELLAFDGQFDRAAKQLDVVAHQDAETEMAAQVYLNLMHAESLRKRVLAGQLRPEFLLDEPSYVELHLDALRQLAAGRPAAAANALAQSEDVRPAVTGSFNDQAFDDFRDCDDILAPFLEIMLIRDYIWLPLEHVSELEVSRPERPRDLLWTPVRVGLTDGTQRRAYMPARYAASHEHADDLIKLGRATDWMGASDGPVQGVGQRQFLIGEDAVAMLELSNVAFDSAK